MRSAGFNMNIRILNRIGDRSSFLGKIPLPINMPWQKLMKLAAQSKTHITAAELAIPFSGYLCEHLKSADRQGTSVSSSFLNACRRFNAGGISHDELLQKTVKFGFNNVLNAFHTVNGLEVPHPFFIKQTNNTSGIILTDEIFKLKEIPYPQNLNSEIEARWRLVETAWNLALPRPLLTIEYDQPNELFFIKEVRNRRINITSAKHALNGYQKGKCFYCFDDICVTDGAAPPCEVEHFIPYLLQKYTAVNLNGVWNLVLSCKNCNHGAAGKFTRVPDLKYFERLAKRNDFFVNSYHPLRETILHQTGKTEEQRCRFLQKMHKFAISRLLYYWHTEEKRPAEF